MLKKLGFKQFTKNDLYSFSLTTKSGRQSPEGMLILQSSWLILGPLFFIGIRAFSKDFLEQLPLPLIIINILNVILLISSIIIVIRFKKLTVKLEIFQSFVFFWQTIVLGAMIFNFGPLFYFSDVIEEIGKKDFILKYSQTVLQTFFLKINLILPMIAVITYIYLMIVIKNKQTRKESTKAKKVEYYEELVRYVYPTAISILVPVIVFSSMINIESWPGILNLTNIACLLGGCMILVFGVNNYMIYYIKKQFPEEYAVSYQNKEENEK